MKRGLSLMTATLAALAALIVSGCTSLTAPAPLFTVADQIGPPALSEGIWIGVNEDCPVRNATRRNGRFPRGCDAYELRRTDDGAWRLSERPDLMSAQQDVDSSDAAYVFVLVPVSERPSADAYSSYYVAEVREEDSSVIYAGVVPIGTMPATSFTTVSIDCGTIIRDGDIAGIEVSYETVEAPPGTPPDGAAPTTRIRGCTASTQAAVREAARRALVETIGSQIESGERLMYVRPR